MSEPIVTLAQLREYEAKLLRAMADPTAETWYDQFKKKNRPVSELQVALKQVRAEIAHRLADAGDRPNPHRFTYLRGRDAY